MEIEKFTAEMAKYATLKSMAAGEDEDLNKILALIKKACEGKPAKSFVQLGPLCDPLSDDIVNKLRALEFKVEGFVKSPIISWL